VQLVAARYLARKNLFVNPMPIKGEIITLKYHNRSLACICITTGHWQIEGSLKPPKEKLQGGVLFPFGSNHKVISQLLHCISQLIPA